MEFCKDQIFVLKKEDYEFINAEFECTDLDVKIYANGFLISFKNYSDFVLSRLLLEGRKTFFFCINGMQ